MQTLKPLVFTTAAQNKTVEMDSGLLQKYRNECWDLAKKNRNFPYQELEVSSVYSFQVLDERWMACK